MLYPITTIIAIDRVTGGRVTNGSGNVYAVSDTARATPLNIYDLSGLPLTSNLLTTNSEALIPPFQVEGEWQVVFVSGDSEIILTSYLGLKEEAAASADAANTVVTRADNGEFKGAQGDSAYQVWLSLGNTGTVEDYRADIEGAPGKDGSNVLPTDEAITQAIHDTASSTRGALNATYAQIGAKGVFVDATAPPYNAKGDDTADDWASINNAAAAVEFAGGGTVYLPGIHRISQHLPPRNYTRFQGRGMRRTIIRPYQSAAFTGSGTLEAPIESPEWFDMTWDGIDIPSTNSLKGQFSEFMRNPHWERVECTNFTATGFGSDFLPGGRYINCIATNNGRGQPVDGPGMSGIGIGTGMWEVEDVLVQGCITTGNTNYGIFHEKQGSDSNTPYNSKGVRIIGNYSFGNTYGIGGCGLDSAVYQGNITANNARDGITLHAGSGLAPLGLPDKRALINGNQSYGNGRDGIHLDYSHNSFPANEAEHLITSNNVYANGRDGFRIISASWASDVIRAVKVSLNKFTGNTGYGIAIVKAGDAEAGVHIDDLIVEDNDVNGNGINGIFLAANLTRPNVAGNKCYDDQAVKTQDYGIYVDPTAVLTDATIKNNNLLGNQIDAAFWDLVANFAGQSDVRGNTGYYAGWASITMPAATPLTYTAGNTPETLYYHGSVTTTKLKPRGAGSYITVGTALSAGLVVVPLEPGDTVQVDYSATPSTVKTIRRQ